MVNVVTDLSEASLSLYALLPIVWAVTLTWLLVFTPQTSDSLCSCLSCSISSVSLFHSYLFPWWELYILFRNSDRILNPRTLCRGMRINKICLATWNLKREWMFVMFALQREREHRSASVYFCVKSGFWEPGLTVCRVSSWSWVVNNE